MEKVRNFFSKNAVVIAIIAVCVAVIAVAVAVIGVIYTRSTYLHQVAVANSPFSTESTYTTDGELSGNQNQPAQTLIPAPSPSPTQQPAPTLEPTLRPALETIETDELQIVDFRYNRSNLDSPVLVFILSDGREVYADFRLEYRETLGVYEDVFHLNFGEFVILSVPRWMILQTNPAFSEIIQGEEFISEDISNAQGGMTREARRGSVISFNAATIYVQGLADRE